MPKETFFNLGEEKQESVMRAAISEFSNNGFEKANIGVIAKNAGVAKGSMYQYFENKKELFIYSVQWTISFMMRKYGKEISDNTKDFNFFDYMLENSRRIWQQMSEEREIVIFIQDVFLGKYHNLTDESMELMLKASDKFMLEYIASAKKNGYIRTDIDDEIISLFMMGVSYKIKEHMMKKAREAGRDMIDNSYDTVEKDIIAMIELMRNGIQRK